MARIGVFIAIVLAAILLGIFYGLPMAILVLAAVALVGSIVLFWASLRTLTSPDLDLEPYRAKAEEIVRAHLSRKPNALRNDRVVCPQCDESNEHDARFCKRCGAALRATETIP
jgi:uncharacterized paraquat-inducible protein A